MECIVTSKQMKDIEKYTIEELGVPSLVLIERASMAAAKIVLDKIKPKNVLVLSGAGNNGADGYAVSRMLLDEGVAVYNIFVGKPEKCTQENIKEREILEKMGQKIYTWETIKTGGKIQLVNGLSVDAGILLKRKYDLIIDGLLGIGINRFLEGGVLEAVDFINQKKNSSFLLSLDVPTGLNADNGQVMGQCVNADATITFGQVKAGLLLGDGPNYTGAMFFDKAGIVTNEDADIYGYQAVESLIAKILYERKITGNKGTFGKVLIIGGNKSMAGAGLLAARAAMQTGAGMVKLLSLAKENADSYLKVCPELMSGYLDKEDYRSSLDKEFGWCDTIIIGPGLAQDEFASDVFDYVLNKFEKNLVIDADGLNLLSKNIELLKVRKKKECDTVITPHPLEFARLFDCDIKDRKHQDIQFIKKFSDKYGIIIVAKDARTITADGKDAFINPYGNSGMAKAGSGDMLAGVVGGLLFPMRNPLLASVCAVGIHGLAGDYAAKHYSEYTLNSAIILESIGAVIDSLKNIV